MIVKILKRIMIVTLVATSIVINHPYENNNEMTFSYELTHKTKTLEDAQELASIYELELIEYSNFGFSVYKPNTQYDETYYLKLGFELNHSHELLAGFPFPTSDKDKFYDDQYALDMMEIESAWTLSTGDPDYLIAIIDTGIDIDHIEFEGRISPLSYNARTDQVGIEHVDDINGHGTSVAGVIAANKDNKEGIAGIVQHSMLLIIQANNLDNPETEKDESISFSDSNIAKSIRYATEQGADIINLSLGGPGYNTIVKEAIEDAHESGIIIVAASGNEGNDEFMYPASYPYVISVGAVDQDMNIADFSTYNEHVDISAPGVQIVTTGIDEVYKSVSGTSFAAPQVTGVIALFQSYLPDYTDQQTITRIFDSAIDKGDFGKDIYYGYGVINAYKAMLVDGITISFETYGATPVEPIYIPRNEVFYVDEPQKEGYDFEGWYLDEAFLSPFTIGIDTLDDDHVLYAKMTLKTYIITFVNEGEHIDAMTVSFGSTFTVPIPHLVGYTFEGWYLDEMYTLLFTENTVTESLTLYAKFTKNPYIIQFFIQDKLDQTNEVYEGDTFDLYMPDGENEFLGWYLEPTFITLYQIDSVYEDLNLYARFDDGQYSVVYYESDLQTILLIQFVFEGMDAVEPSAPDKASTPSFDYTFIGWSDSNENIRDNLSIYPLYQEIYIKGSIGLNASIDTVFQYSSWIDRGVTIKDDLLTYELREAVDLNTVGRYELYYDIYFNEAVIDTLIRIVHVIEPKVEITLNKDITTLYQGETYNDQGATSNLGEVTATSNVDTQLPGVYEIIYEVVYNEQLYTAIKYVYVVEKIDDHTTNQVYIIPKTKEWDI